MKDKDLFIKLNPQTRNLGLYRHTPCGIYDCEYDVRFHQMKFVSTLDDAIKQHHRLYVSVNPLPEIKDEYYIVGGKRFELDNRKGAEWYAGKFAARKGQRPRFDKITVYKDSVDRESF